MRRCTATPPGPAENSPSGSKSVQATTHGLKSKTTEVPGSPRWPTPTGGLGGDSTSSVPWLLTGASTATITPARSGRGSTGLPHDQRRAPRAMVDHCPGRPAATATAPPARPVARKAGRPGRDKHCHRCPPRTSPLPVVPGPDPGKASRRARRAPGRDHESLSCQPGRFQGLDLAGPIKVSRRFYRP